jgi:hypothetical protein
MEKNKIMILEASSLVDFVYDHLIKKSKYKFVHIDEVSEFLKKKLGDEYTSEMSIQVKQELRDHEKLDFFREDTYIEENKYHYSTGNWLAVKGLYDNPVQAKNKMGWYAWQETEEIDWDNV